MAGLRGRTVLEKDLLVAPFRVLVRSDRTDRLSRDSVNSISQLRLSFFLTVY